MKIKKNKRKQVKGGDKLKKRRSGRVEKKGEEKREQEEDEKPVVLYQGVGRDG